MYIDTKTTRSSARVSVAGRVLRIGRRTYPKALNTVIWEAESASKALGVPVAPVIAVHGAKVPRKGIRAADTVLIVSATRLRQTLTSIPHQHDPQAATALASRAAAVLPPHSAP